MLRRGHPSTVSLQPASQAKPMTQELQCLSVPAFRDWSQATWILTPTAFPPTRKADGLLKKAFQAIFFEVLSLSDSGLLHGIQFCCHPYS